MVRKLIAPILGAMLLISGAGSALAENAVARTVQQPVDHTFWYVSRAAGFTAYLLLTLSVCLGLLISTRLFEKLVPRWRSFDLHQFVSLLSLAFVGLHVFALLGDQYVGFGLDQLFIPLASSYRPLEVAIGIVGLYLMIVTSFSFYLRRWIGYQTWRTIHYLTFGVFLLALGHGVLAGTDTGEAWVRVLYWGTGTLVAVLTVWRVGYEPPPARSQPRPVPVAAHDVARPLTRPSRIR